MQRNNHWRVNLLKIALNKVNRRVLSTQAYRTYTRFIWMGNISQDTSIPKVILGTLFFPLIPCLIRFKNPHKQFEGDNRKSQDVSGLEILKGRGLRVSQDMTSNVGRFNVKQNRRESASPIHLKQPVEKSGLQKIGEFYSSPIVKYYTHFVFYVGFLLLFALILMTHVHRGQFSPFDGLIVLWILSFTVEKAYQFVTSITAMNIDNPSFMDYITNFYADKWNILDTISQFGFVLGFVLRLIPVFKAFETGRLILSIDFICFSWRLLHIFTISKRIGPMLVMVWKMMMDLVPFLVILLVSIISFAVASEAILYPNATWSLRFVLFIPKKAFFSIFGEFFLDEIEGTPPDDCVMWDDDIPPLNSTLPRCPSTMSKYAVPFLMALYILITNVLLLNILIARFNYTFQTIHQLTDEIWAWQSVRLTLDYESRLAVPPPFTLIWRFVQLCVYCCCHCCRNGENHSNTQPRLESPESHKSMDDPGSLDVSVKHRNNLNVNRTPSDSSQRSRHSEKMGENDHGDVVNVSRPVASGDKFVKSRSRTDLLKSVIRPELISQLRIDDENDGPDDGITFYEDDFETEIESMGDFERSMGEIHLAVRPTDIVMRGKKSEKSIRRPISVIRPTIRMKNTASRETDA